MTSLAPTLQAFFTTRLTSQYGASPHTVAAYRDTWRLLLAYAAQSTGTAPAEPGPVPARRGPDQRIPHRPGSPARQQHRHPQRPSGRGALVLHLRIALPPRTPGHHRPGLGDPAETQAPQRDLLPHRHRGHRTAGSAGPDNQGRTTRPRDAPTRRHRRATRLRAHRTPGRRRPSRRGCARALPRQRPQEPNHAAGPADRARPAGVHRRTTKWKPKDSCSPPAQEPG